jgi:tRNA threonylcarbamoyladenosine biosynthesis protein TsaE
MTFTSTLAELPQAAKQIIDFADKQTIWVFDGEMGAGKTTLIRAIGAALGITDNVSSPTYSIVNEYLSVQGVTYYHFDFYRLKHETEAIDIGTEDYFESGKICFLEWASLIPNLLPSQHLYIKISIISPQQRQITLLHNG